MNSNWSYSPETPNMGQIQRFLELCDLEIWRMTLKNNRAPLLSNIKLCAAFRSHWWIQTGVTVRKRVNQRVFSRVTLQFDVWTWKTIGHLFYSPKQHQALCIISSLYLNSNWSYSPETAKLAVELCDVDLWPLTLTLCMDVTFLIGSNSWKFCDDTMIGT